MTHIIPLYGLKLVEEGALSVAAPRAEDDHAAARIIRALIADRDREVLVALFVDKGLQPIGLHTIAIGAQASLQTTPREPLSRRHSLARARHHPGP
jgi:DNA repair protein RadC